MFINITHAYLLNLLLLTHKVKQIIVNFYTSQYGPKVWNKFEEPLETLGCVARVV